MKTETYIYRIPAHFVVALLYDDTSGFSGADEELLLGIEKEAEKRARLLPASHYHWKVESQEPEFTFNPDFGLAGDCIEVALVLFAEEAA